MVVAHSMDRLVRNLDDLRHTVQTLTARGIRTGSDQDLSKAQALLLMSYDAG